MGVVRHIRLVDGPLLCPHQRREEVVRRMAADLVEHQVTGDKRDIIRFLLSRRYTGIEVARNWADALQVAVQDRVAKEMSAP